MGHILFIEPIFKEMVWGGQRLKQVYDYPIPSDHTGECWAISAHQNGDCLIRNSKYQGMSLSTLYQEHRELFGNIEAKQFPLLVKIIDASQNLSVQVHPNDEYARIHENSLGKTECWYVIDCLKHTQMVIGHHAKTKEELIHTIKHHEYASLLNQFEIQPKDFFYIPAGTIHAICAGSLIYEVQQSSDITYRVYDYDRVDSNGKKRELHLSQSIDTINVPDKSNHNQHRTIKQYDACKVETLIVSPYFTVKKYEVYGEYHYQHKAPFSLVSVLDGKGTINHMEISKGDHLIICNDVLNIELDGLLELMVTTL